jgi:hypothetical protein
LGQDDAGARLPLAGKRRKEIEKKKTKNIEKELLHLLSSLASSPHHPFNPFLKQTAVM